MHKNAIIDMINQLETTAKVYCDNYGPSSEEVKEIDEKISKLNAELLDIMCPE